MSVREIFETPALKGFLKEVQDMRAEYSDQTNTEESEIKVRRAQGAIEAIDRVLGLPEIMDLESKEDPE